VAIINIVATNNMTKSTINIGTFSSILFSEIIEDLYYSYSHASSPRPSTNSSTTNAYPTTIKTTLKPHEYEQQSKKNQENSARSISVLSLFV